MTKKRNLVGSVASSRGILDLFPAALGVGSSHGQLTAGLPPSYFKTLILQH